MENLISLFLIMNNEILDSDFSSENAKSYAFASFGSRLGASIVDTLVFVPLIVLMFYNMTEWKNYPLQVLILLGNGAYKPLMEGIYGATLGKMALNIRVVTDNYEPIDMEKSVIRNVFYIASYLVSFLGSWIIFNAEGFDEVTTFLEFGEFSQTANSLESFEQIVNLVLLLSCLLVAFDRQNQSVHDKIAKTFVVEK